MKDRMFDSASEYRRRLARAVAFIDDNIDRSVSLDEIAQAACFSKFHFHRLFTAWMNETPGDYVTRKKMERAAIRLVYANASVSTLADAYAYSSVAAFSKAFNQWFGCRPTELKAIRERVVSTGGKLQSRYGKELRAEELLVSCQNNAVTAPGWDEIQRRVSTRQIQGFALHYLTSPEGYDPASIWVTWARLKAQAAAVAESEDCRWFAISHDHPGLTTARHCRYDACVALPAYAGELTLPLSHVPDGLFAIFQAEGPEASILCQYLSFYTCWMPQSGYEPADFPVLEHYLPGSMPGYIKTELWAMIQPITYT